MYITFSWTQTEMDTILGHIVLDMNAHYAPGCDLDDVLHEIYKARFVGRGDETCK